MRRIILKSVNSLSLSPAFEYKLVNGINKSNMEMIFYGTLNIDIGYEEFDILQALLGNKYTEYYVVFDDREMILYYGEDYSENSVPDLDYYDFRFVPTSVQMNITMDTVSILFNIHAVVKRNAPNFVFCNNIISDQQYITFFDMDKNKIIGLSRAIINIRYGGGYSYRIIGTGHGIAKLDGYTEQITVTLAGCSDYMRYENSHIYFIFHLGFEEEANRIEIVLNNNINITYDEFGRIKFYVFNAEKVGVA